MNVRTDIIKPPKQDIFQSGKFRSIVVQSIVMFLVVAFLGWIVSNTATNMKANGISHGVLVSYQKLPCFDIGYLPFIDHTAAPYIYQCLFLSVY